MSTSPASSPLLPPRPFSSSPTFLFSSIVRVPPPPFIVSLLWFTTCLPHLFSSSSTSSLFLFSYVLLCFLRLPLPKSAAASLYVFSFQSADAYFVEIVVQVRFDLLLTSSSIISCFFLLFFWLPVRFPTTCLLRLPGCHLNLYSSSLFLRDQLLPSVFPLHYLLSCSLIACFRILILRYWVDRIFREKTNSFLARQSQSKISPQQILFQQLSTIPQFSA